MHGLRDRGVEKEAKTSSRCDGVTATSDGTDKGETLRHRVRERSRLHGRRPQGRDGGLARDVMGRVVPGFEGRRTGRGEGRGIEQGRIEGRRIDEWKSEEERKKRETEAAVH